MKAINDTVTVNLGGGRELLCHVAITPGSWTDWDEPKDLTEVEIVDVLFNNRSVISKIKKETLEELQIIIQNKLL